MAKRRRYHKALRRETLPIWIPRKRSDKCEACRGRGKRGPGGQVCDDCGGTGSRTGR